MSDLTFDAATTEAVVLDAGGVLVLPHAEPLREALEAGGITWFGDDDAFKRAHYAGMRAYDNSTDSPEVWDDYVLAFIDELHVPTEERDAAARALRNRFDGRTDRLWIWAIEETRTALQRLSNAGIPLAVVSNADGYVETALAVAEMVQVGEGPGTEVHVIVDSTIVGIHKPDPRIFPHALDVLGLPADRCLYIGDSVRNDVVGALSAGLHPVHLDPFDLHADDGHDHDRVRDLNVLADLLGV